MGLELIAAAVTIASTAASMDQRSEARKDQRRAQSEQRAVNAAQQAAEKRQQIREERIRRARVQQSAYNTGTIGSSGEEGALGALSTKLASNLGFNKGLIEGADRMSMFSQSAANHMSNAQTWNDVGRLSSSIFSGFPTASPSQTTLIPPDDRPNRAGQ